MTAPLVGLTTRTRYLPRRHGADRCQEITEVYVDAVRDAGGLPVLLPSNLDPETMLAAAERTAGVVLTGGEDVDPLHFGEEPRPGLGPIEPARDAAEIAVVRRLADAGRPLLGICRGVQVMNVALGGDVVQHLPAPGTEDPVAHTVSGFGDGPGHDVIVEEGTLLHSICGRTRFRVSSGHHQAPGRPAPGLVVSARAADGVIEALERPAPPFFLGVQWHPERTLDAHRESRLLFRAFVEACGG